MSSEKRSKNRQNRASTTRTYKVVAWLCSFLFLALIGYIIYFQIFQSKNILNNKYNTRLQEAAEKVSRGSILARDGQVLAETVRDQNGEETRNYPFNSLFAHPVGYASYGGSGLEAAESTTLLTSHSNIVTQFENELNEEKKQGDNVVTTLDVKLQTAARDALGSYKGTVLAMDSSTGDILCDYSAPGFDPNTLEENWDSLTQSTDGNFINRSLQGLYPPGSTFKLITALTYLREHGTFDDFSYNCTGSEEYEGFSIHCVHGEVHGQESFADAMANSCNCAFAHMALNDIDKDDLRATAESMGFNKKELKTDLPYEQSIFTLDSSTPGQLTMQTAIGQGDTRATPMQMLLVADAAANGGKAMNPNFITSVQSSEGTAVQSASRTPYGQLMTSEEAEALKGLMKEVVKRGTASRQLSDLPYNIAGKTGTAEHTDEAGGKAHSWFVGFSDTGYNDIAVCVLVEDGDLDLTGAYVARQLFTSWFGG
ncbi:MAG: penicillin-binding transpeptidase domain-containing protein [Eubacterium sp.]|nr:penicillin-binding transpeptidase domain-containing protein [Eubacterium sp.]